MLCGCGKGPTAELERREGSERGRERAGREDEEGRIGDVGGVFDVCWGRKGDCGREDDDGVHCCCG